MERGQASVETAVLLPAMLVVALACWQALLVGWTSISAEHAARAAARARLIGAEPRAAAAGALRAPSVIPGFDMAVTAEAPLVGQ
jgi:hypothetical protein